MRTSDIWILLTALLIGAVLVFLGIKFMLATKEAKAQPVYFKFTCAPIPIYDSPQKIFMRCENDEVLCYVFEGKNGAGGLSCDPKK